MRHVRTQTALIRAIALQAAQLIATNGPFFRGDARE